MNLWVFYSRKWNQLFIGDIRSGNIIDVLSDSAEWPPKSGCRCMIYVKDGRIPKTFINVGKYD